VCLIPGENPFRVSRAAQRLIDVHVKDEDGWITVSVSDNGGGIPNDNYDKVFVPNLHQIIGTGLGLAITKQIIDGTGGRIWFESAENVGTTFYVRMKKMEPSS